MECIPISTNNLIPFMISPTYCVYILNNIYISSLVTSDQHGLGSLNQIWELIVSSRTDSTQDMSRFEPRNRTALLHFRNADMRHALNWSSIIFQKIVETNTKSHNIFQRCYSTYQSHLWELVYKIVWYEFTIACTPFSGNNTLGQNCHSRSKITSTGCSTDIKNNVADNTSNMRSIGTEIVLLALLCVNKYHTARKLKPLKIISPCYQ